MLHQLVVNIPLPSANLAVCQFANLNVFPIEIVDLYTIIYLLDMVSFHSYISFSRGYIIIP